MSDLTGNINQGYPVLEGTLSNPVLRGYSAYQIAVQEGFEGTQQEWLDSLKVTSTARVTSLTDTEFASGEIIEAIGDPIFIEDEDLPNYSNYGLTKSGFYVFARITIKDGYEMSAETTVTGAAGYILDEGYVDVAVYFEIASVSQKVTIDWGEYSEAFVFKATDLAVNNLDYRVTFYVYDIDEFVTWEYKLTEDTTFVADNYYYTKNSDEYKLAEVTVGETIPADTYYVHAKATFEGMTRNITYRCNTVIDCPITFILPEIEDDSHGAWFEIRFLHNGSYSMTLVPPSDDIKVATEHSQTESKGINMVDLHYSSVGGKKVWRFMNTHSSIPE